MRSKAIAFVVAAVIMSAGQGICASQDSLSGGEGSNLPSTSYYYNYPHPVPPDYVYRTERIFPAPERKKSWWQKDISEFFNFSGKQRVRTPVAAEHGDELKLEVRELSAQLLHNSSEEIADDLTIIVSSFVNLDQLYRTSAFGRYIGEQLIGELQLAGIEVIDVRKTPGIMVREGFGEYSLSRDMEELSFVHSSQATLVGTYTVTAERIFINTRLLRNSDGMVLSSGNLVLVRNPLINGLLGNESAPSRQGKPIQVRALTE